MACASSRNNGTSEPEPHSAGGSPTWLADRLDVCETRRNVPHPVAEQIWTSGRCRENRVDFLRRKIIAPLLRQLAWRHVVIKPPAIHLKPRAVIACDRLEVGPAFETSSRSLEQETHQPEQPDPFAMCEIVDVRQFMCEDRPHTLDRRAPSRPFRIDENEVLHTRTDEESRQAERRSEIVGIGSKG